MRVELIVLGFLMTENLSGYDIKRKTEEQLKGFSDLKAGSIYYALRKANKNNWIKKVATEKEEGTPDKFIYKILPAGKKHFKNLLKEYFQNTFIHFNADMLLLHIDGLTQLQREEFLEERTEFIKMKMDHVKEASHNNITKINYKHILTYLEQHLKAEMTWLKSLDI